jgi:hypothetical protein
VDEQQVEDPDRLFALGFASSAMILPAGCAGAAAACSGSSAGSCPRGWKSCRAPSRSAMKLRRRCIRDIVRHCWRVLIRYSPS